MPYMKPNNTPLYVNKNSNHPPAIIKNIPLSINRRLSDISSDKETFDKHTDLYQKALDECGYQHKLEYEHPANNNNSMKERHRKIIWYNPPFNISVKTNIGKLFLKLVDSEFPTKHALHKIFNRNTIKISYSCCTNIKNTISAHNAHVLNKSTPEEDNPRTCNCRNANQCPLGGECLLKSIVYQATVVTTNTGLTNTYVGLTESAFKTRYANHKASFTHRNKKNSTELSKYIWQLKDSGSDFSITWKVLKRTKSYSNSTNSCSLCNWEKYFIITKPTLATLNKRNELVSACRHRAKYSLKNFIT